MLSPVVVVDCIDELIAPSIASFVGRYALWASAPPAEQASGRFLWTAVVLCGALTAWAMARALWFFHACVYGACRLHDGMFRRVIRCPMLFFDSNPSGRILNRFSKDVSIADDLIPATAFDCITIGVRVAGVFLLAGIINPLLFVPLLPIIVVFRSLTQCVNGRPANASRGVSPSLLSSAAPHST